MRHAMFLVPVALALMVSVAAAESVIGIGMFAGAGIPSGQIDNTHDSKTGLNMGFRFPMAFSKMFSLEPFLDRTEYKSDEVYFGTLDGFDNTAFGANLGIGRLVRNHGGLHLTPFVGGMMGKFRREGGPGKDKFGWQAGLQVGLHGSETAHWDIRGAYQSFGKFDEFGETDSRKAITISLGITAVVAPR